LVGAEGLEPPTC